MATSPRSEMHFAGLTLLDALRYRAEITPDRVGYVHLQNGEEEEAKLTYLELHGKALAVAARLQAYGAQGERVLLLYPPGLDFVVGLFGCMYAGSIGVPAYNPRMNRNQQRLRAIADDATAKFVLTTAGLSMKVREEREFQHLICLASDDASVEEGTGWTDPKVGAEDIATIQYTSGSTGNPKGVVLTHRNLLANARVQTDCFGKFEEDRIVSWTPVFHDMGFLVGIVQPVWAGVPVFGMAPSAFVQQPIRWLEAITKYKATVSGGPNFAYDLCVDKISQADKARLDLSSWRVAFNGAEPVRAGTLDRFIEAFGPCGFSPEAMHPCYGLAEATLMVSVKKLGTRHVVMEVSEAGLADDRARPPAPEERGRRLVSSGSAVAGVEIRICDAKSLAPCTEGEVGEICVRGESNAQGYWKNADLTAATFDVPLGAEGKGFLRTGDLGFCADGELFVTGRRKDLIIIRGANYYPQDIEAVASGSHASLVAGGCAAFSVDLDAVESLVVVQEVERSKRRDGLTAMIGAIRKAITEQYELQPHAVVLISQGSLARTSSGKIQRYLCREEFQRGELQVLEQWVRPFVQTGEVDAPTTLPMSLSSATRPDASDVRGWLVTHLARLTGLSVSEIDVSRPFAEYGLDSKDAVGMSGELEAYLGQRLSATLLYDHPTIDALCLYFDTIRAESAGSTVAGEPVADEQIAVVGMACRLPGAPDLGAFWKVLRNGVDTVGEAPVHRWTDPESRSTSVRAGLAEVRWGGFLEDVDLFDAKFFGISRNEAESMDPQQRLLLETTWQALEDAGLQRERLRGTKVGSFIGISTNDYLPLVSQHAGMAGPYMATGNAFSIAANRLSYFFDWRGPSIAIDTACSSSLVAIHMACESLRRGECGTAIAGGVNVILSSALAGNFSKAGLMSPEGRCKSFDADANGFVRSEGVGAVVLKPLSAALADGDRVYCVIRGSAVNQDGRSNGLMAPNRDSQVQVLREACDAAQIEPHTVGLVEAHGSGTLLGDAIELSALREVFEKDDRRSVHFVGSVKSNIGHAEAAAGVAGFIKTALALHHRLIPPSLHYTKPNPHAASGTMQIATALQPWRSSGPRRAGVSSFGFGGTNAHIVLEEAAERVSDDVSSADDAKILTISAHTPGALRSLVEAHAKWLELEPTAAGELCYTMARRHMHHVHRVAFTGTHAIELQKACEQFLSRPTTVAGGASVHAAPRYCFVFPGHGSQWAGMGATLYRTSAVFRATLTLCDTEIRKHQDWSLLKLLLENGLTEESEINVVQPALFAIQVALVALWKSWGVVPDAVVGQSLGEITAAYVAGVLSLEEAVRLTCCRGDLLRTLRDRGGMLMTAMSRAEAETTLRDLDVRSQVSVGVCSSPSSTVLSGDIVALEEVARDLTQRKIYSQRVKIDYAAHSGKVDPLREEFLEKLGNLKTGTPSIPLYSTVTGQLGEGCGWDAAYWWRSLRDPVLFAEAVPLIAESGVTAFLEVSPHPVASYPISECLRDSHSSAIVVSSLRRDKDDKAALLDAVAALYMHGAALRWDEIVPSGRVVSTPAYAFERSRYWIGDAEPVTAAVTNIPKIAEATSESRRKAQVIRRLRIMLGGLLRMEPAEIDVRSPFLEMGADSIVLITALEMLNQEFGVTFSIRQLFEELTTVDALAERIVAITKMEDVAEAEAPRSETVAATALSSTGGATKAATLEHGSEDLFREQLAVANRVLDILAEQMRLLGNPGSAAGKEGPDTRARSPQMATESVVLLPAAAASANVARTWTAYNPIQPERSDGLTERQRTHLDALIGRYTARTQRSKTYTQQHRTVLADNRASAGFRYSIKEMLYPVQAERSQGSRLWDIDGNEYVDLTMGFGVNLFGHGAAFVMEALQKQLAGGIQLGPQSKMAGEVARAIAKLTGMERVTFCNSGTEAVMMAVRLARTATERKKLVVFSGSYHGTHDGVLGRSAHGADPTRSVPLAPGILQGAIEDIMVLAYGEPGSLETIARHGDEIAGVLVEPVQSRRPDLQPREFLHALRAITRQHGAALIFDEIITGFRLAPGGAQEWFDVRADLATYGKILGGGMPIGVVAGAAQYLDGIDGGHWQYGDASYPKATTTVFAGTFCKHPLAMASAHAVLQHMREAGPLLQQELNARTGQMASELNAFFVSSDTPIRIVHCGSLFRFDFAGNMDLLFYHMLEKGLYVWEGRNCFLSTAHTASDIERIVSVVKDSIAELRAGGFLPDRAAIASSSGERTELVPQYSIAAVGPLLRAQTDLWRLCTRDSYASRAYHVQAVVRLEGTLDVAVFARAVQNVLRRHTLLNVKIAADGMSWESLPDREIPVPFAVVESLDEANAKADVAGPVRELLNLPFDLAEGPLVRTGVFATSPRSQLFVLVVHHVVADGVSLAVVLKQIGEEYSALVDGSESFIATGGMTFADYVTRSEEQKGTPLYRKVEDYWRNTFEGFSGVTNLPADFSRPRLKTYGCHPSVTRMRAEECESLKRLGVVHGASSFMILFAAFTAYIHRLSGQTEIVVGIPISDRHFQGGETLVGYCTNVLAIRSTMQPESTFLDHLFQIRSTLLDAFENRQYPFSSLIDSLKIPRDVSRLPLVDVMFNLDKAGDLSPWSGLNAKLLPVSMKYSAYDLSLNITEIDSDLTLELLANRDLFLPQTADSFLDGYLSVIRDLSANGDKQVSSLRTMGNSERQLVLHAWNATRQDRFLAGNVCQTIQERVVKSPDAAAVIFGDDAMTYLELNKEVTKLARYLIYLGVGLDVRVALFLERSFDLVVAILAILKAGGAFVPLDTEYPEERLRFMIADAGAGVVLTHSELARRLPASVVSPVMLDHEQKSIAAFSDEDFYTSIEPLQLAYVIYTSGSTGRPKGAMNTHLGLYNRVMWMQNEYLLTSADRVLQKTPCSFDVSVWEFIWPLMAGATLVVARPGGHRDPDYLSEVIERERITTLHFVPPMLAAFLQQCDVRRCGSLRHIFCSGETLPAEIARRCLAKLPASLHNLYGPTEAAIDVTAWHCERGQVVDDVPIGRPIANLQTYVLDDWMEPVPIGVAGELFLGGVGVGRGYLNAPATTAERFVPDPFSERAGERLYRTGDLAQWLRSGNLKFLGRKDFQVKIRGFRIELEEIERVLLTHPEVHQAVAVVHRSEVEENRIAVYVVRSQDDSRLSSNELSEHLLKQLPKFMAPSAYVFLDMLPLGPNGKTDRTALPEPMWEAESKYYVAPRNDMERQLVTLWSEVLALRQLGVRDNFFEVGGDSILALRIVSRARDEGLLVQVQDIFEQQTIEELALKVTRVDGLLAPIEPRRGYAELSPIQERFFEQGFVEPSHWNQSLLLNVPGDISTETIQNALRTILQRHDALRLRFEDEPIHSRRRQYFTEVEDTHLECVDLHGQSEELEAHVNRIQASLDIFCGPVFHAAHFDLGEARGKRLLLVAHHLVIDVVSWQVLVRDLVALCDHSTPKQSLPRLTNSFAQWSRSLQEYAASPQVLAQRDYWEQQEMGEFTELPKDETYGLNTNHSEKVVEVRLASEVTAELERGALHAYRAQMQDVVVLALTRALGQWAKTSEILLDVEQHGRESGIDAQRLDYSHTVGWFTTIFPLRVQTEGQHVGRHLLSVKEHLHTVPDRGLGYGVLRYLRPDVHNLGRGVRANVLVNYLGRMDQQHHASGWSLAVEGKGQEKSPLNARTHLLELDARIEAGQLYLSCSYSEDIHRQEKIVALMDETLRQCYQINSFCKDARAERSPSDFPLAIITQSELDALWESRPFENIYQLSATQQGILFHSLHSPQGGLYVNQLTAQLHGRLDVSAFHCAWKTIVDRHPVLRSRFAWQSTDTPLQVVDSKVQLPWETEDLRELTASLQKGELDRYLVADRTRGFDLEHSPAMRVSLFQTADERFTVVWTQHHLILDGWSTGLLWSELFNIYEALSGGRPVLLPTTPRFSDYIRWFAAKDQTDSTSYWKNLLSDFVTPTILELRPGTRHNAGAKPAASQTLRLSEETSRMLESVARQHGVPLNAIVQTSWALLLSCYSGQADVLFGTVFSGRPEDLVGVEEMVGLFISTVPVRFDTRREEPLWDAVRRMQDQLAATWKHQYCPLTTIQGVCGIPSSEQMFTSVLVFENYPVDKLNRVNCDELNVVECVSEESTHYELTAVVSPGPEMCLQLLYSQARVDSAAIGSLLEHWQEILEKFTLEASSTVQEAIRDNEARNRLLHAGSGGHVTTGDTTVLELWRDRVMLSPKSIALQQGNVRMTYEEVDQRANDVCSELVRCGARPETVVAICLERTIELVVALVGVLKSGAAYLPLDPGYPDEQLRFMVVDSAAIITLTSADVVDRLSDIDCNLVLVDQEPATYAGPPVQVRIALAENLFYTIYTSGSTGKPKCAGVTHEAFVNLLYWYASELALTSADSALIISSFTFDATHKALWGLLFGGGTVHLHEGRYDPRTIRNTIRESSITLLTCTPSAFYPLIEFEAEMSCDLSTLRHVVLNGEVISADHVSRWAKEDRGKTLITNAYGPTECTDISLAHRVSEEDIARGSWNVIGQPISQAYAWILQQDLELAPPHVTGELYIGGLSVGRGYLNRPEMTAARFVPDPYSGVAGARMYRTGDRAAWNAEGVLEYRGRVDDQIKVRGFRVEPAEIEHALHTHSSVKEAVVLLVADERDEARLIAYLVLDGTSSPEELTAHLRSVLPPQMIPSQYVEVAEMPLSANGKLDRKTLRAMQKNVPSRHVLLPSTETERVIASIFGELLPSVQVSVEDSFFDIGGHSLLAIRLASRLRRQFGVDLSLETVFEQSTVVALAAIIDRSLRDQPIHQSVSAAISNAEPMQLPSDQEIEVMSEEELDALIAEMEV